MQMCAASFPVVVIGWEGSLDQRLSSLFKFFGENKEVSLHLLGIL